MPCTYTIKFKEGETLMVSSTYVKDKCIFPYMIVWENIIVSMVRRIGNSHFSRKMNDNNLIIIYNNTYNVTNN
jgi:hypothetical protein